MTKKYSVAAVEEPPFRTSPSAISRYFFHDCERFLRYTAAGAAQRKLDNVPARDFDHSPLMKAILESGYSWEQMVLDKYLKGKAKIAPGKGDVYTRRFDWAATVDLLRTAKPDTYLYQPTLRTPKAFYDGYGIDPALVTVSDNHPDLIAVLPGGPRKRHLTSEAKVRTISQLGTFLGRKDADEVLGQCASLAVNGTMARVLQVVKWESNCGVMCHVPSLASSRVDGRCNVSCHSSGDDVTCCDTSPWRCGRRRPR